MSDDFTPARKRRLADEYTVLAAEAHDTNRMDFNKVRFVRECLSIAAHWRRQADEQEQMEQEQ